MFCVIIVSTFFLFLHFIYLERLPCCVILIICYHIFLDGIDLFNSSISLGKMSYLRQLPFSFTFNGQEI